MKVQFTASPYLDSLAVSVTLCVLPSPFSWLSLAHPSASLIRSLVKISFALHITWGSGEAGIWGAKGLQL